MLFFDDQTPSNTRLRHSGIAHASLPKSLGFEYLKLRLKFCRAFTFDKSNLEFVI